MKKILIITILTLSLSIVAQNRSYVKEISSLPFFKTEVIKPQEKAKYILDSRINSNNLKDRITKLSSLVSMQDSSYTWSWDVNINSWSLTPNGKVVNYAYDSNGNMIGITRSTWSNSMWVNDFKYIHTFNASNYPTSQIVQYWNGTNWENSNQTIYTYDSNNNLLNELVQNWSSNVWVNGSLGTSTYNSNNSLTSYMDQNWISNQWENVDKQSYIYNTNNLCTNDLSQNWNGSAWENYFQDIFTYNTNNDEITSISQVWNVSSWENSSQSNDTYDTHHNRTLSVAQNWNGSSWSNSGKFIKTYDLSNNETSSITQNWDGTNWIDFNRSTSVYNVNNGLLNRLYQKWNGTNWINTSRPSNTFDATNFQQSSVSKVWNSAGTSIASGDSTFYYYRVIASINNIDEAHLNFSLYPNPSNYSLSVLTNIKYKSLRIFNSFGQIVSDVNEYQMPIPIFALPNDVYLLQIIDKDGAVLKTEKFIKN